MKRLIIGCLLSGCAVCHAASGSTHLHTDSGLDFYVGLSAWGSDASAKLEAAEANAYFDVFSLEFTDSKTDSSINPSFYTAFEHPLVYLPNIALQHNRITHEGQADWLLSLTSSPDVIALPTEGEIDLSHTDIVLYYNVLDGTGFLDLGLTLRLLNGSLTISTLGQEATSDLSTELPLVYLKTGMHLPLPGLRMGLLLNAGDTGGDRSADASLYMEFETEYGLGVTGGYRYFTTDIQSEASTGSLDQTFDIDASFDIAGPFFSIFYHL